MDIKQAIAGRRAVRDYSAQAVDERTIRDLIEAAVQAPGAVNQQPCTFTVVRDQGMLDRISHDAKAHMLATMPASTHSDHFRSLLGDPAFQIFYHAPVLILISGAAPGSWIVEDCSLAAENLMLAAYLRARTKFIGLGGMTPSLRELAAWCKGPHPEPVEG